MELNLTNDEIINALVYAFPGLIDGKTAVNGSELVEMLSFYLYERNAK